MNYNRGCYRQPIATPYSNRITPSQRNRAFDTSMNGTNNITNNMHNMNNMKNMKMQNEICDSKEMNYKLAMVYSPYQEWQNIYNGEKALETGTIFAELDKPFYGYKCSKGVCSL